LESKAWWSRYLTNYLIRQKFFFHKRIKQTNALRFFFRNSKNRENPLGWNLTTMFPEKKTQIVRVSFFFAFSFNEQNSSEIV
jgi:hypothetical protein